MPWLPQYEQTNWGAPPNLHAESASDLIRSIWAMRQREQENLQSTLAGAIQQFARDKVANTLSKQYAQEGLIPQELAGQGYMGLGAAQDYIKTQERRTFPTKIGEETYPLTQDQRVRLAIAAAAQRARAGAGGAGGVYGEPTSYTDDQGRVWVQGVHGGWHLAPVGMQPTVQQQRQQASQTRMDAATQAVQRRADEEMRKQLFRVYRSTPADLTSEREYGTATEDEKGVAKPNTFEVTPAGKLQTHVRFKTIGGGSVIMPRNVFETYYNRFHPQEAAPTPPPADQNLADGYGAPSAAPSPLPGTFQSDLQAAQAAIAQGRDRAAVLERMQKKYPDEDLSGL